MKVAILISGRGSNMLRIADMTRQHRGVADIVLVAANKPCDGLALAAQRGLNTVLVNRRDHEDRASQEAALAEVIENSGAQWILLAGYMAILSPWFVARFSDRILNIHPSLLPDFKGLDTHERALAGGVATHGATVHLVNAELDGGPIILQAGLEVGAGEDERSLAARVLRLEHALYPFVVMALSRGWLAIENGTPEWHDGKRHLAQWDTDVTTSLVHAAIWPDDTRPRNP